MQLCRKKEIIKENECAEYAVRNAGTYEGKL